ncbi:hypothetical protein PHISCL_03897 [Aspergillus sclerotialis]|uniref:Uncharacterized protein n=1 Tax=Aspergillus sclerotialis TaxID=2070753 RepID=A0A3A2ZQL7_9EURO|nr:hypothetical protein PHISCL_03897 [Aspergillus sclerotialis]
MAPNEMEQFLNTYKVWRETRAWPIKQKKNSTVFLSITTAEPTELYSSQDTQLWAAHHLLVSDPDIPQIAEDIGAGLEEDESRVFGTVPDGELCGSELISDPGQPGMTTAKAQESLSASQRNDDYINVLPVKESKATVQRIYDDEVRDKRNNILNSGKDCVYTHGRYRAFLLVDKDNKDNQVLISPKKRKQLLEFWELRSKFRSFFHGGVYHI